MADVVDVEVLAQPEDPRIDPACKEKRQAETAGACDGFPNPCDMCDCFYESSYADVERDIMRHILAAADAVDPVREELRLHRQQLANVRRLSERMARAALRDTP